VARRNRLCVPAALVLLALSACGARQDAAGEPTPTSPSTTTTTPTTTPATLTGGETSPPNQENRCAADWLAGTIAPMDSEAGDRYVTLVLRNKSQQVCSLWGFGSVELLSNTKESLPTNVQRNLAPAPALIELKPGAEAGKILHWSVVATGDEPDTGPCQPPASALRVKPPDETGTIDVAFEFGSVCDQGRLDTSAYFAK
jgi:hypothetical protein